MEFVGSDVAVDTLLMFGVKGGVMVIGVNVVSRLGVMEGLVVVVVGVLGLGGVGLGQV